MHTCAYCGRRLLWLHRVVDGYRYCCREHARLHRTAREEAARERGNAGAAGAHPPLESLLKSLLESGQQSGSAAALSENSLPEAPLYGFADQLVRLATPPVDFEPVRASTVTPVPEDPGTAFPVVRVLVIPGREPAFPAPHAALVPLALAPVAAGRRNPAAVRPLRPRRTVLAPAHRPAAPPACLREAGAVVATSWLAPAGEWLRRSSEEEAPAPPASSFQEPNSVLVFSFLEGGQTSAGSREAAPPLLRQRARLSCGALLEVPARPLEWRSPAPLSGALVSIPVRTGWQPPALLWQPPPAGVVPRLQVRTGAAAVLEPLDEQAAPIQPFRLHRMPMKRLHLRPIGLAAACPPRNLPALRRMLFLNALHVPRASCMPYRPDYRLLPPPAAFADAAQPCGDSASHAANRRQGE